jgi:hypothetical protein
VSEGAVLSRAIWALPAAGLLLGVPWLKPWFADAQDLASTTFAFPPVPRDLDAWARIATSDGYVLFGLIQRLGLVCLLFGVFALYAFLARGRSPRWATAALILGVTSIVTASSMLGVMEWARPHVASMYQSGIDVCLQSHETPEYFQRWPTPKDTFCGWAWAAMGFPQALTLIVLIPALMALALAVAIWRSGLLSRWVALPFAAAFHVCLWLTPLALIGGLLMVASGGWIAFQRGREGATSLALPTPLVTR